jgi:hypothetical protein
MQSAQDVDLLWALYSAGSREAGVVSKLASSLGVSETVLYNGNATTGAVADAHNRY